MLPSPPVPASLGPAASPAAASLAASPPPMPESSPPPPPSSPHDTGLSPEAAASATQPAIVVGCASCMPPGQTQWSSAGPGVAAPGIAQLPASGSPESLLLPPVLFVEHAATPAITIPNTYPNLMTHSDPSRTRRHGPPRAHAPKDTRG